MQYRLWKVNEHTEPVCNTALKFFSKQLSCEDQKLIYYQFPPSDGDIIISSQQDLDNREAKRTKYDQDVIIQRGIASPSPSDQEHLLIIRLDITGAIFAMGIKDAKRKVQNGLKHL